MAPSSARVIISWDTNTKSLRLTEEAKKSRKRTADDDRVSDGTHQPPPQKKAAVVQQSAQPSSHAIIAAPTAASSSGYHGVFWDVNYSVFRAKIHHNGKQHHVGRSADAKEAAFMRDRAWRDLGKDPSKLNFDDTVPIPNEYLASVANASKRVASHATPEVQQSTKPSSIAIEDGGAPLQAAEYENEVPPAAFL